MKINYTKLKNNLVVLLLLLFQNAFSKDLYGGIEIGSKGIKVSVIDMLNVKKSQYEIKGFWTENVGIAKGISIDGNLALADMEEAIKLVMIDYDKLLNGFKVENSKIFIVISSGVGMARNVADLANKIKELTKKEVEVISSKLEAKLSFKGCVPLKSYSNALFLDIGGGNTKGGYTDDVNDNPIFFPINLDLGTITLTEKINKKTRTDKLPEFIETAFNYLPTLRTEVNKMYQERPLSLDKKTVYFSGGAVWAFFTLNSGGAAPENYNAFTYADVLEYNAVIQNNFKRFEELATTNEEVQRVLKTYSQKSLISANNLLLTALEGLGVTSDTTSKKLFFVKQGQISWLLSYIVDSSKGAKVVY